MKKICLFLLLFTALFSFAANESPSRLLKKQFLLDYRVLEEKTNALTHLKLETENDWQKAETAFFEARLAYKKIELFVNYLDREYVKDHINGAPLLHTERKAPDLVVLAPSGFQIMEEQLFEKENDAFLSLAANLDKHIVHLGKLLPTAKLSERMVFEALREEVVRLAALGITGFDTPSTLNTINECLTVFTSLKDVITVYNDHLSSTTQAKFTTIFDKGMSFFAQSTYDSFNRYEFIRTVINPLYKLLLFAQKELLIETKDLVFKHEFSVNYNATSIFDTDFLNYAYYSSYSNSGDLSKRQALGKLLFFDPLLSSNNERACASCHHPNKAFSDGNKTSLAFDHQGVLKRNAPGLINSIYNTRLFWDARANTPEQQVEHVLFDPKEFNSNYDEVTEKLNSCKTYLEKFDEAYPKIRTINRYTIVASISAYIQSLRSYNSEFDKIIRNEKTPSNNDIIEGFNLFTGKGKCATCHFIPTFAGNVPPLYVDTETEVLGIPDQNNQAKAVLDSDLGRYANGRPSENAPYNKHSFKTPTVRNIALTAPYMHNGVFETLTEVVEYYNIGGGHGWGIAPDNATLGADSLHLSEMEIKQLVLFMEALTDTTGLTSTPQNLPHSTNSNLNNRVIGGRY